MVINKYLTKSERFQLTLDFVKYSDENRKLKRGMIAEFADKFEVSSKTIGRYYKQFLTNVNILLNDRHKSRSRKLNKDEIQEKVKKLPVGARTTIRSIAEQLNVPKSTLHRYIKDDGVLKKANVYLKPKLKPVHKIRRLNFILKHIHPITYEYNKMTDIIHIDEKWFYIQKICNKIYVVPEEELPHLTTQNKNFIQKVMFLTAVSRPHIKDNEVVFDGKIGIWPIVTIEAARRSSVNRPAGTPVTKCVTIDRKLYKSLLIDNVFPAIFEKFPFNSSKAVYLQQDNARPHCSIHDPEILAAGKREDLSINLVCQPAQSPDMNVLDLGFFSSIQSIQNKKASGTIDELITNVIDAFMETNADSLDNVFLTLQHVMNRSLECDGDNSYKLSHIQKSILKRNERTNITISADQCVVDKAINVLLEFALNFL